MARIVMKFGGTSVADIDRIRNVARHVKREVDCGHEVAVVVSAMAGKTNELVELTRAASPMHDAREYDAIVASGELVTAGLLAIVLQSMGVDARSWQGWQIPIKTDNAHGAARISEINGGRLIERFGIGQVAVIAGFQGVAPDNRVSTLVIQGASGEKRGFQLSDNGNWQAVDLSWLGETDWFSVSIRSVFSGSKYKDTAISELRVE